MERIKQILIRPEISVAQALKQMDVTGKRALFITDKKNKILGLISDGDIRRWILKNKSLNEKITKVMNKNPIILKAGYSKDEAKKLMLSEGVDCIPVVDENKSVVSVAWWLDLFDNKFEKVNKKIDIPLVIMAGGEGTRLYPFTNILPKPLIPIGEKPIIELIIDRFRQYGCNDFYLSMNYKSNLIEAYLNDLKPEYNIHYIREEKPLGTAGGLYLLKNKINTDFFVTNCDILIDADYHDILKFHKDNKNKITVVVSMKHFTIPYGICKINEGGILKSIQEKPEYVFMVNTGLYLIDRDMLNNIPSNILYNMTDLISDCMKKGGKAGVYPISEKCWVDIGQLQELQDMLKKIEAK